MREMTTEQKAEAWDKLGTKIEARIAETEPLCEEGRERFDFARYGKDVYEAHVDACNLIELMTLEEVSEMIDDLVFELTGDLCGRTVE